MQAIEAIEDPKLLKQVAVLLQRENERLHRRLEQVLRELAVLRGAEGSAQLALELEKLQAQVNALNKKLFCPSSEKREQPGAEQEAPKESTPKTGHGPRPQPQLRQVEIPHELKPDERKCGSCQGDLRPWDGQFEESEEISVVEREFVVVKHKRAKYRCKCEAAVTTAPGPDKLISGGRYSVEFAVDVAIAKYLDHMPLARQTRVMERESLLIDTQTLWDQINALAHHVTPSYALLPEHIRRGSLVHIDETWWRLMDQAAAKKWWVWALSATDAVYYRIVGTRAAESPRELLQGYRGTVLADGYAAYQSLARAGPGWKLAHCWAHVRRKWVEIEDNYRGPSEEMVNMIRELYAIEKLAEVSVASSPAEVATVLELRAKLRAERSRPVIDRIREWAYAQRATRESGLHKALEYMLGLWPGLVRFLDDPHVPLDNNLVERELRPVVVGRKNHYGSRSKRGTEVAAVFYSLIETAKLNGVEPKAYLLEAARRAVRKPGTTFLPFAMAN